MLEEVSSLAPDVTLSEARQFAVSQVHTTGDLTGLSAERMLTLWARFERFALHGHGVSTVGGVTEELVRHFVESWTTKGQKPSIATQHLRRASIRLLFRVLRQFGLANSDPTLDLRLPARSDVPFRPLTDDEVELARWASLSTLTMTRRPAVWALAEAGASTAEIPHVTVANVHAQERRVWISGGPKTDPRWSALTEWGAVLLARRLRALSPGSAQVPVTYDAVGSACSARTSASEALRLVLRHAGLLHEPGVRVRSVTAWTGRRILTETGDIAEVARRLGLRSLDLAAELVGWDWRDPTGEGH